MLMKIFASKVATANTMIVPIAPARDAGNLHGTDPLQE